jgi:hypothetical protein
VWRESVSLCASFELQRTSFDGNGSFLSMGIF